MKKFYLFGGMAVATALFAAAATFPTASPNQIGGGETPDNQDVTPVYADAAPQADGAETVPYYSPAASSTAISDGWTIIDTNKDNVKWVASADSSSPCGTAAKMSTWAPSSSSQNDYLISPYIHLEAGVEYAIVYNFRSYSTYGTENMTVYLTKGNTLADMESGVKVNEHLDYTVTSYKKFAPIFTPTETGDYCVAFWCHSPGNKYYVYVADLLVTKNEFAPAGVTGLNATVAAERELKCTLSWTLPTEDIFGNEIPDDKPIEAVKVYRDGAEIENANLDATATEFTDTDATGLTSGKHTYAVSVVAGGVESAKTQGGPTDYVGPIVPFTLPATFSCATLPDYELWTTQKGAASTDTHVWEYDKPNSSAKYQREAGKVGDDWLITPPVKVEDAGYYRLKLEICKKNPQDGAFVIEMGTSASVDDMQPLGESFDLERNTEGTFTYWPVIYKDIKVDAAGTYYFAVHNVTPSTSGGDYYYVHSLSVEQVSLCPEAVTDLVATPAEDSSLKINVSWTNPTNSTIGEELTNDDYKLEIYLNDSKAPAATVEGGTTTAQVTVPSANVYTVTVKAVSVEGGASAPVPASVKTTWVGPRVVAVPYSTKFAEEDATRDIWEIHDLNNDGHAFTIKHNTSGSYDYLELTGATEYKDYMVTPVFNLATGLYKVTVYHAGAYSVTRNPVIGLIKKNSFNKDDVAGSFIVSKTFANLVGSSPEYAYFTFKIDEAGEYQIVYGDEESVSDDSKTLELRSFSLAVEDIYPAEVKDLIATISEEKANTIELSWTNPSTIYDTEYELSSIESIVIKRDGEVVATLTEGITPGETSSYTDEGVDNGVHTYTVYATLAGKAHEGAYTTVTTEWVGGGQAAPIHITGGKFTNWTTLDVDGNHGKDGMYEWKLATGYSLAGSNFTNDDYLISSPVKIEQNGVYEIKYYMSAPSDGNAKVINVGVKMGSHKDDVTTYQTVHTISLPENRYNFKYYSFYVAVGKNSESEIQPASNGIMTLADGDMTPADYYNQAAKIPSAGDYRVALHLNEQGGGAQVTEFHLEKVADYDATTEIVEVGAAKVTFDGKAVNFNGVAAVQVYNLAGVCVANATAEGSFDVCELGAGYYIVKVTTDSQTVTLKVTVK